MNSHATPSRGTAVVTLRSEESRCELLPAVGGSIAAWTVRGQPLLRTAQDSALLRAGAFAAASFPLVPFSNRIGGGQFAWGGRQFSLARNFSPEPHAIHGVGFERAWTLSSRDASSAVLSLRYPGGAAWPFPFHAEQRIVLGADSLVIEMSATNLGESAVPLSFGHHPYFPRAGARLQFGAQHVWMSGEDALPTLCVRPFERYDFSAGADVERGEIDHCFTGWDGTARISWREQPLALQIGADNLSCAVVYVSAAKDEFCFEPVAHVNDAINRAGDFAMPVVAAGDRIESRIELRAVAAD